MLQLKIRIDSNISHRNCIDLAAQQGTCVKAAIFMFDENQPR